MRKIIFLLLLSPFILIAQNVIVVDDKPITELKEGTFYFPVACPDGSGIIFSSANGNGLWYKNISTGRITKITNGAGAGYEPVFNNAGSAIYFRENKFVNGRMISSLKSYQVSTKKTNVIADGIRDLKVCKSFDEKVNSYIKGNEYVRLNQDMGVLRKSTAQEISVYVDNSKIVLVENGIKRFVDPIGNTKYIWTSISPDNTKLLFTGLGKGTFVSTLDGKILKQIGYANYPTWSADGNWILFMKDIDDGVKLIASDIYVANLNTGKYFNLTLQQGDVSIYPKWGADNTTIFYNTDEGRIRKITLKYE